ncbi:DUF1810 family protein, partial [Mycobacterium tuberculosis]|nr:DUF1810 family protein [Mycobacterium tuberculosis]
AHPVLGPRLEAVTRAVLAHPDRTLHAIFGSPDDRKFRSSMTLFARAAGGATGSREENALLQSLTWRRRWRPAARSVPKRRPRRRTCRPPAWPSPSAGPAPRAAAR